MFVEQKTNVASGLCRFQQVQRSGRVHAEVDVRIGGGPVVRRLSRGVDDEFQPLRVLREDPVDRVRVADVRLEPAEVIRVLLDQLPRPLCGRG